MPEHTLTGTPGPDGPTTNLLTRLGESPFEALLKDTLSDLAGGRAHQVLLAAADTSAFSLFASASSNEADAEFDAAIKELKEIAASVTDESQRLALQEQIHIADSASLDFAVFKADAVFNGLIALYCRLNGLEVCND